jgi:predicted dehydrogenase
MQVAIVGFGYWGKNIYRAINSNKSFEVTYICDSDASQFKTVRNDVKTTSDLNNILNDSKVQTVFIVTTVAVHFTIAKKCIESNKNIVIAKPLCYEMNEIKDLYRLASINNVKIIVDYTYLYNPCVEYIKNYFIDAKEITGIDMYRKNTMIPPKVKNVIWDLAPHDISILLYILGDTLEVIEAFSVNTHPILGVCNVVAKLRSNKTEIVCIWTWDNSYKERKLIFKTNSGSLIFDEMTDNKLQVINCGWNYNTNENIIKYTNNGTYTITDYSNIEPLVNFTNNVYDIIANDKINIFDEEFTIKVTSIITDINKLMDINKL